MVAGAIGGGIALGSIGATGALALDLASFLAAAALYARISAGPAAAVPSPAEDEPPARLRDLFGRRTLLVAVLAYSASVLAIGLVNASLPRILDGRLGLGPGFYGFALAAVAGGLALGQAAFGSLRMSVGPASLGRALLGGALALAILALATEPALFLVVLVLVGVADGVLDGLFETILQREAEPRLRARVLGAASVALNLAMVGAFGAAPLVSAVASPGQTIFAAAAMLTLAAGIALAPGAGRTRTHALAGA